jgi:hypothetical protein
MRPLAALALLAACGGQQRSEPPPPPPPPDAAPAPTIDADEVAAAYLEVVTTMTAIVEERAAAKDCAAMVTDLDALVTTSQPLFDRIAVAQLDPDENALLVAAFRAHHDEALGLADRISAGLDVCIDQPGLFEIIQRLPAL